MKQTFKVEQLLSKASELGFTKHDFADLAIIAARRAGVTAAKQVRVATALGIEAEEHDRGTKADHVEALARLCAQLGGRLAIVSGRELSTLFNSTWPDEPEDNFDLEIHDGYSPAAGEDMDHGLNWREKIIYAVRGRERVGSIIHEMGHVFADRYPPDNSKCREWRWFGWEMAVARQIGAWTTWSRYNESYGIGGDVEWGELSAKRRQAVIAARMRHAKKLGLLSETGEPQSIR